jgi:exosortase F-associated protein
LKQKSNYKRILLGAACLVGLVLIYLFQKIDVGAYVGITGNAAKFIFNKSYRFLANDFLMIGLIYALFYEKKYIIFALWVQLAGLVFILIPYFLLKLVFHTGNGPLVSFLHRLILNPTLLILLIPAFYYQRTKFR